MIDNSLGSEEKACSVLAGAGALIILDHTHTSDGNDLLLGSVFTVSRRRQIRSRLMIDTEKI